MRRLLSAARHRRHREALGNRPTLLRGSAGSPAARGTGRTGRKPRDGGFHRSGHGRAVPGPEGRTPQISTLGLGQTGLACGAPKGAASPSQGARRVSRKGARQVGRLSALHPLTLFGEGAKGIKAYPAPFQIIRAMTLGCLIFESGAELLRHTYSTHSSLPGLTRQSRLGGYGVAYLGEITGTSPVNDEERVVARSGPPLAQERTETVQIMRAAERWLFDI